MPDIWEEAAAALEKKPVAAPAKPSQPEEDIWSQAQAALGPEPAGTEGGGNPWRGAAKETGKVLLGFLPKAGRGIVQAVSGATALGGQALETQAEVNRRLGLATPATEALGEYGTALRQQAKTGELDFSPLGEVPVTGMVQAKNLPLVGELFGKVNINNQEAINLTEPKSTAGKVAQTLLAAPVEFAPIAATGLAPSASMAAMSGLQSADTANKVLDENDPNRVGKLAASTAVGAGVGAIAGKLMPSTQPLSRAFVGKPWSDSAKITTQTALGRWLAEAGLKTTAAAGTLTGGEQIQSKILGTQAPDLGESFLNNFATMAGFTLAHGAAQAKAGAKAWQVNEDGTFSFKAEGKDANGDPVHGWFTARVDPDGLIRMAVPDGPGQWRWVAVDKAPGAPDAGPAPGGEQPPAAGALGGGIKPPAPEPQPAPTGITQAVPEAAAAPAPAPAPAATPETAKAPDLRDPQTGVFFDRANGRYMVEDASGTRDLNPQNPAELQAASRLSQQAQLSAPLPTDLDGHKTQLKDIDQRLKLADAELEGEIDAEIARQQGAESLSKDQRRALALRTLQGRPEIAAKIQALQEGTATLKARKERLVHGIVQAPLATGLEQTDTSIPGAENAASQAAVQEAPTGVREAAGEARPEDAGGVPGAPGAVPNGPEAGSRTEAAGGDRTGRVTPEEWDRLYAERHETEAHPIQGKEAITFRSKGEGDRAVKLTRDGNDLVLRRQDGSNLYATIHGSQVYVETVDSYSRGNGLLLYEALADYLHERFPEVKYLSGAIGEDPAIQGMRYAWPSTLQRKEEGTSYGVTRLSDIVNRDRASREGGRRAVDTAKKEEPNAAQEQGAGTLGSHEGGPEGPGVAPEGVRRSEQGAETPRPRQTEGQPEEAKPEAVAPAKQEPHFSPERSATRAPESVAEAEMGEGPGRGPGSRAQGEAATNQGVSLDDLLADPSSLEQRLLDGLKGAQQGKPPATGGGAPPKPPRTRPAAAPPAPEPKPAQGAEDTEFKDALDDLFREFGDEGTAFSFPALTDGQLRAAIRVLMAALKKGARKFKDAVRQIWEMVRERAIPKGFGEAIEKAWDNLSGMTREVEPRGAETYEKTVEALSKAEPKTETSPKEAGNAEPVGGKPSDSGDVGGQPRGVGAPPAESRSPRGPRAGSAARSERSGGADEAAGDRGDGSRAPGTPSPGGERDQSGVGENFRHTPETLRYIENLNLSGSEKQKIQAARNNVAAIRLVQQLEAEGRLHHANDAEKAVLAKFVGWGALKDAVDYALASGYEYDLKHRPDWMREDIKNWAEKWYEVHKEVASVLSPQELRDAKASTLNAHYTSPKIAEQVWSMLVDHFGFTGGNVLEPSVGTGVFFGTMPEGLVGTTSLAAAELEPLTAKIASALYPQAEVFAGGYQDMPVKQATLDLVIGNVPFDNSTRLEGMSLHNFFFKRGLSQLKPGGIMAAITSTGTMDAINTAARDEFSGQADLVGAIRLPMNAFSKNAGTQVTTDILIFRKRDQARFPVTEYRGVIDINVGKGRNGEEIIAPMNEYFHRNPENLLGELVPNTMNGAEKGLALEWKGTEAAFKVALEQAIQRLPAGWAVSGKPTEIMENAATANLMDGAYLRGDDGKARVLYGGTPMKATDALERITGKTYSPKLRKEYDESAETYMDLKDALRDLRAKEFSDAEDAELEPLRAKANALYDKLVNRRGAGKPTYIGNGVINPHLTIDPDYFEAAALEIPVKDKAGKVTGYEKADILLRRVGSKPKPVESVETPQEALVLSMAEKGGVDPEYLGKLLGQAPEDALRSLVESGDIFEDPTRGGHVPSWEYLSGNVRKKLREAKEASKDDPSRYAGNIQALEDALPPTRPISTISVRMGETWISPEAYREFLHEVTGFSASVSYNEAAKSLVVDPGRVLDAAKASQFQLRNPKTGAKVEPEAIIKSAFSWQMLKVDYAVDKHKTAKDEELTIQANDKVNELRRMFSEWISKEGNQHGAEVEAKWNEVYNSLVRPTFPSPPMDSFPNQAKAFNGRPFRLEKFQVEGVFRNLLGNTLDAHVVGAGKTITGGTTAMELRRLGLARKPIVTTLRSVAPQFAAQMRQVYPTAKILVRPSVITPARRKAFLQRLATMDFDMAILTHEDLSTIPDNPDRVLAYVNAEMDRVEEAVRGLKGIRGNWRKSRDPLAQSLSSRMEYLENLREMVANPNGQNAEGGEEKPSQARKKSKQAEKSKNYRAATLAELLKRKQDKVLDWDAIGADALIVDESHKFKRLDFFTRFNQLKGVDTASSKRSLGFFLKTQALHAKKGRVITMTGTPITNTMAEIWTNVRYLRPDLLDDLGISEFDDFVKAFGEVSTKPEMLVTGDFENVTRLRRFVNVPELQSLLFQIMHRVKASDIKRVVLPKVKGGGPQVSVIEGSPELQGWMDYLRSVIKAWDGAGKVKKETRHIPVVVYGRAAQLTLDPRMIDPTLPPPKTGKLVTLADKIAAIYHETTEQKGAQAVFSERFMSPKNYGAFEMPEGDRFNAREELKRLLVERGLKPEEIVTKIPDGDKARENLFAQVNAGDIRLVMGGTQDLGTGVNIQDRLAAVHHMDLPYTPADFAQRNGRIERAGNSFDPIGIDTYAVKGTSDSFFAQILDTKSKFINQLLDDTVTENEVQDVGDPGVSFEEISAAFTGDPRVAEKISTQSLVNKLEGEKVVFEATRKQAASEVQNWEKKDPNSYSTRVYYEAMEKAWKPLEDEALVQKIIQAAKEWPIAKGSEDSAQRGTAKFDQGIVVEVGYGDNGPFWQLNSGDRKAIYTAAFKSGTVQGLASSVRALANRTTESEYFKGAIVRGDAKNKTNRALLDQKEWPGSKDLAEAKARLEKITKDIAQTEFKGMSARVQEAFQDLEAAIPDERETLQQIEEDIRKAKEAYAVRQKNKEDQTEGELKAANEARSFDQILAAIYRLQRGAGLDAPTLFEGNDADSFHEFLLPNLSKKWHGLYDAQYQMAELAAAEKKARDRGAEAGFINPDVFTFPFKVAYDLYRAGARTFPKFLNQVRQAAKVAGNWEAVVKQVKDLWQAVKLKHQTRGLTDAAAQANLVDVLNGPDVTLGEFQDAVTRLGNAPVFRVGGYGFRVSAGTAYVQIGEGSWRPIDSPADARALYQTALQEQNHANTQAYRMDDPRTALQMLMGRSMKDRAIGVNFSGPLEKYGDLPTRLEQKYGSTVGWVFRAIDRWHTATVLYESQHADTRRAWEALDEADSHRLFKFMVEEGRFAEPTPEGVAAAKAVFEARVKALQDRVTFGKEALARAQASEKAAREALATQKDAEPAEKMKAVSAIKAAVFAVQATERFLERQTRILEKAKDRLDGFAPRGRRFTGDELAEKGFKGDAITVYMDSLDDYQDQIEILARSARAAAYTVTSDITAQVDDLTQQIVDEPDALRKDALKRRVVELEDEMAAAERLANYYEELPLHEQAYVPLVRTGNYAIKFLGAEDALEGVVTGRTESEVKKKAEAALKEWPKLAQARMTDPILLNDERSDFARSPGLEDLQKAARLAGLNIRAATDLTDAYEVLNLQERNARGFKVHLRHAKGLPGYEINGPQAHALYTQRAAKFNAHMVHGRTISRRISTLEEVHKQGASVNTEAVAYLRDLAKDVFNNPVSSFVVRINQFADVAGLGLNFGFILQQMAQKVTHELPTFQAVWAGKGYGSVEMAAMRAATAMIGNPDFSAEDLADIIRGHVEGDADALAKETMGAMKRAEAEGAFIDEQTQETRNAAQGYDYGTRGKTERVIQKVHQVLFTLVRNSELHNRRQTFIGAYLLGRTQGYPAQEGFDPNAEPDKMGRAAGKDFVKLNKHAAYVLAEKMVDWIHNKRGVTNRAKVQRWGRGIANIPLKFRYFQYEYPQLISRLFEDRYERNKKNGMSPGAAAADALKPVMASQLVLLALGGIMGPWALSTVLDWLDLLWNDVFGPMLMRSGFKSTNAFNWRSWEWMPKFLKFGLPAFGGFNISRSIGMGDQLGVQRGDTAKDAVFKLFGAAPAMAVQSAQAAARGDAGAIPVKGIGQAARAITQDKLHPGNGYTVPLTPGERAMMAVGIKPQSVAEAQDLAQQKKLESLNKASERKAQGITEAGRERRERGRKNQGFLRQLGR